MFVRGIKTDEKLDAPSLLARFFQQRDEEKQQSG
jgi:hypothetical protein